MRNIFNFFAVFMIQFALSPFHSPSVLAAEPEVAAPVESDGSEDSESGRYAGPEGFRKGKVSQQSLEIFLDGKKVATLTGQDLEKLTERKIFTPRGPKVAWSIQEAIEKAGIKSAKNLDFVSTDGKKKINLDWAELVRAKGGVVVSYNFDGILILETDVEKKLPEQLKENKPEPGKDLEQEENVRKEFHKNRKRSLIFMRDLARIDIKTS